MRRPSAPGVVQFATIRPLLARSVTALCVASTLLLHGCADDDNADRQFAAASTSTQLRSHAHDSQEDIAPLPLAPALDRTWPPTAVSMTGDACSGRLQGSARTLDLGPGQAYTEGSAVPWLSLEAGDVVNVHYRDQPYRVKIALAAQGRADAQVVINGVTDANCNRPVISGADARISSDAAQSGFFRTEDTERLATIFLQRRPTDAYGSRPSHITLRNLEITGAHRDSAYTGQDGVVRHYLPDAAGVYASVVDDLTIENSVIHGNGNGVFVDSRGEDEISSNVVVRGNAIYDNGIVGSATQHNVNVQARRALYEGNYLGQLILGADGSSLQDRSSGTVIRYNRIDAAARAIDLLATDAGGRGIQNDPLYADAWVYGNSIINDLSTDARSSSSLVRWSGGLEFDRLRGGTLHWYHNTVQTLSDRKQLRFMALFDTPQLGERVLATDNAFVNEGTTERFLVNETGRVELVGANYLTEGWQAARSAEADVQVETPISVPGQPLDLDGHAMPGGPLVDAASSLALDAVATLPATSRLALDPSVYRITHQPAAPWGLIPRPIGSKAPDVGAFEVP